MIFISTNVKHVNTEKKSDMLTCNFTEIRNNPWNQKVIMIFRISWMTPSCRARCQHIHGVRAFCKARSCTWVNFLACCPDGLRDPPETPRNSFFAPSYINLFLHHHVEKKNAKRSCLENRHILSLCIGFKALLWSAKGNIAIETNIFLQEWGIFVEPFRGRDNGECQSQQILKVKEPHWRRLAS